MDLWVVPRAARPGLGPLRAQRLRAAVSAPPVDGAANEAVRSLVADALNVARGEISLLKGATGRNKTLRVRGDSQELFSRAMSFGAEFVPITARGAQKISRKA